MNEGQPTGWHRMGSGTPAAAYPRGWSFSSLPPAPGHGNAASLMDKYIRQPIGTDTPNTRPQNANVQAQSQPPTSTSQARPQATSATRPPPRTKTPPPPPASSGAPTSSGFSVAKTGRRVAQATVTNQRDYATPLENPTPPTPRLESGDIPSAPGRVSNAPAAPKPPPAPNYPARPNAYSPVPAAPSPPKSGVEVIAGDFGKVLGGAKKRIEEALNEAIENRD